VENKEVVNFVDTDSSSKIARLESAQLASLRAIRLAAMVLQGAMNDMLTVGPADGSAPDEIEDAKARTWEPVDKSLQRLASVIGMIREDVWAPPQENLEKLIDGLNVVIAQVEGRANTKARFQRQARLDAQLAKIPPIAGTRASDIPDKRKN